jgi:hypothetical protein
MTTQQKTKTKLNSSSLLDYLLPEHEAIIVKWGGIVELNPD